MVSLIKKVLFCFLLVTIMSHQFCLFSMDTGASASSSSEATTPFKHLQKVLRTKNLSIETLVSELEHEIARLSPKAGESFNPSKHLFWCTCDNITQPTRIEIILTLVDRILAKRQTGDRYNLTPLVSHTDLGEEKGLQSYLTAYTLFSVGFKSVVIHMINKEGSIYDMKKMLNLMIAHLSKRFFPKTPTRKDPNPSVPTEECQRMTTAMIKCMNAGYTFYGTVSSSNGITYSDNIQNLAASKALTPPFFASESYVIIDPANINLQQAFTFFSKNPLPKLVPEESWGWVCNFFTQQSTKATKEDFVNKIWSTLPTAQGCNTIHIKIDRLNQDKASHQEKIASIKQRYNQPALLTTIPATIFSAEDGATFDARLKDTLTDLILHYQDPFTPYDATVLFAFLDELKSRLTEIVPPDFVIMVSFDYSSYCQMLYEFDFLIDHTSRRNLPASIIIGSQNKREDYQFNAERQFRFPL